MTLNLLKLIKSSIQLGFFENANYLWYQILLKTGIARLLTPTNIQNHPLNSEAPNPAWFQIWPEDISRLRDKTFQTEIFKEADAVLKGKFTAFGMVESDIDLNPHAQLCHWTKSRSAIENVDQHDIKFIWEPARFSWAIALGQAYYLSKEEKYAEYFWLQFNEFMRLNPLNQGPNWQSAQEVALRLIALIITMSFLQDAESSTIERKTILFQSLADHAGRIPPTLSYAKAQNNNHLISEAVGLYTAGTFLPNHPKAEKWKWKGLKWFDHAIDHQISKNGEYIQHSTNYHRMMLMLAIWMQAMLRQNGKMIRPAITSKLSQAIYWLLDHCDLKSGQASNLGHNDGSYILPFSPGQFQDYRSIIQTASYAFLARPAFKNGIWDHLSIWLGLRENKNRTKVKNQSNHHSTPRIGNNDAWATLRAVQYHSRPAHADQLHVNLWYQGFNIFRDAGTYKYNAPPPWDNGFARTRIHNSILIDEKEQMTRAGRFLWLDWAQAEVVESSDTIIRARHSGYKIIGLIHERTLKRVTTHRWEIIDHIISNQTRYSEHTFKLHWLLPDWPIQTKLNTCQLEAPFGHLNFQIEAEPKAPGSGINVYRAGASISEDDHKAPRLGWYSPTYGRKDPAISIVFSCDSSTPLTITSRIIFE